MASNAGPMMQRPSMGFMAPAMMSPQQQQMMMMQQQQQMMQQQQAAPQAGKWQNDLFDGSVVSSSTSAKL
jgi:type IV secretory pathway VirB9-like protein